MSTSDPSASLIAQRLRELRQVESRVYRLRLERTVLEHEAADTKHVDFMGRAKARYRLPMVLAELAQIETEWGYGDVGHPGLGSPKGSARRQ